MSNLPANPSDPAIDLFDRWLAHRQQEDGVDGRPAHRPADTARTAVLDEDDSHPVFDLFRGVDVTPGTSPRPQGSDGRAVLQALTEQIIRPRTAADDVIEALGPSRLIEPPSLVIFSPVKGTRRLVTGLFGATAVGTVIAAAAAVQAPGATTILLLLAFAGLAALLWSARTRAGGTRITVESGLLKIDHAGSRHQFPLVGSYPEIDVVGEPDDRGWKVLIHRRGMAPYAVTSAMVDPVEFTRVIRQFRPAA